MKDLVHIIQERFGIIGNSELIYKAVSDLLEVSATDLSILITGETGTGKEIFANAAHYLSERKDKPFVSVNCGAIPETLLESELFGHEKGAFTSSIEKRVGFFEAANNGTIFLDEIGEMPLLTQVKLLRVLESGEFSRLGSSEVRRVNIRLIAATNRDLLKEVEEGNFRQDLYYRLNQFVIKLPALREHIQDIPVYFDFFAKQICDKNKIIYKGICDDAIAILKTLPWPGNIREFKNLVYKIITLEKGELINATIINKYIPQLLPKSNSNTNGENNMLPIHIKKDNDYNIVHSDVVLLRSILEINQTLNIIKNEILHLNDKIDFLNDEFNILKDNYIIKYEETDSYNKNKDYQTLSEIEKEIIEQRLKDNNYNKSSTSRSLGISLRTLYRKMEQYNLE